MKTVLYSVFILLLTCFEANAQGWKWGVSAPGDSSDHYTEGGPIGTDASGNVYVGGSFIGTTTFGTTVIHSAGVINMYVAKFDRNGTVLWVRQIGGKGDDECLGLAVDLSGNVYFTGCCSSSSLVFGTTTLHSNGYRQIFLAKFDTNGNPLWAKLANGTTDDESYAVSLDAAGNAYITGYFTSTTVQVGSFQLQHSPGGNLNRCASFLIKYDSNGNVLWANSLPCSGFVFGNATATDPAGNVIIAGFFANGSLSYSGGTLGSSNNYALFIIKYDPSGNVIWARTNTGQTIVNGNALATDASGNVFLAGAYTEFSIDFGHVSLSGSLNSWQSFLVKYDSSGTDVWAKGSTSVRGAQGYAVNTDTTGKIYVTGSFTGPSVTFDSITLHQDTTADPLFIVTYDPSGKVICANSLSSGGDDVAGIVCSRGYEFISGDVYEHAMVVGSDTLTPVGLEDFFLAKYVCCGKVAIEPDSIIRTCPGVPVTIQASGTSNYSWSPASGLSCTTCPNPIATPVVSTVYTLQGTTTSCQTTNRVTVLLDSIPLTAATATPTVLCPGGSSLLTASGATSYQWSPSTGLACPTCPNTVATPTSSTTYTITGTKCGKYDSIVTIYIQVFPAPVAVAVVSPAAILPGDVAQLSGSGGGTYNWTPGTDLSCVTCPGPAANPLETTNYCLIVTDGNGCRDTSCVSLELLSCQRVFVPNYFSPNGDGDNDVECIYGLDCVRFFTFSIFDRWGEQVFETNDAGKCWDGSYQNRPLDSGVFVYTLKGELLTGKAISQRGSITLVR